MKPGLRMLPLEVWVEIFSFPWISREQMGRIVDKIGNYNFAEYLQFYLHNWGKLKLKLICFCQRRKCAKVCHRHFNNVLQQTAMPKNIKSFEWIQISHFDAKTRNFLHQIGPILSDVQLELGGISPNNIEDFRFILANLLPLLDGINSLASADLHTLPMVEQCFGDNLANIKKLKCGYGGYWAIDEAMEQTTANFLLNWLFSPAQDNSSGPRFCEAILPDGFFKKICSSICQEFLAAEKPCTFALRLELFDEQTWLQFAEFHLQNSNGEELHGVMKPGYLPIVQITRHRANCGTEPEEWIEAENTIKKNDGLISIIYPTIGGLLDAIMDWAIEFFPLIAVHTFDLIR